MLMRLGAVSGRFQKLKILHTLTAVRAFMRGLQLQPSLIAFGVETTDYMRDFLTVCALRAANFLSLQLGRARLGSLGTTS